MFESNIRFTKGIWLHHYRGNLHFQSLFMVLSQEFPRKANLHAMGKKLYKPEGAWGRGGETKNETISLSLFAQSRQEGCIVI